MNITTWTKKNNIPTYDKLILKTKKYIKNKNWYKNSNKLIKAYYKNKSNMFIDILAITSPRTTVKQNTKNAIKTINNMDKIDKMTYGITTKQTRKNLKLYLKTGTFNGLKINQFADSLNLIDGSICIDVWMLKAFNINRNAPTYNDVKHINHMVKHIAKKLNLKTYEVQASLWSYAKNELNDTSSKDYYDFTYYLKAINNQSKIDDYI